MGIVEILKSLEEAIERKDKDQSGKLLGELLKVVGMNRNELAKRIGCSPDYFYKLLAKTNVPSTAWLAKLRRALPAAGRKLPKRYLRILIDLQEENPNTLGRACLLLEEYETRQGRELSDSVLLAMLEMDGIQ